MSLDGGKAGSRGAISAGRHGAEHAVERGVGKEGERREEAGGRESVQDLVSIGRK